MSALARRPQDARRDDRSGSVFPDEDDARPAFDLDPSRRLHIEQGTDATWAVVAVRPLLGTGLFSGNRKAYEGRVFDPPIEIALGSLGSGVPAFGENAIEDGAVFLGICDRLGDRGNVGLHSSFEVQGELGICHQLR